MVWKMPHWRDHNTASDDPRNLAAVGSGSKHLAASTWTEADMRSAPILGLAVLFSPLVGVASASPLGKELADAVGGASQAYQTELQNYQFASKSVTRVTRDKDGGTDVVSEFRGRQRGAANLFIVTPVSGPGTETEAATVICKNGTYQVELAKAPGATGWALVRFNLETDPRAPDLFRARGATNPVVKNRSPYWLEGDSWLPDVFGRASTVVGRQVRADSTGRSLVDVTYNYPDPDMIDVRHTGKVTLDSNRHWVVTGYEHNTSRGGNTKRTVRTHEFDYDSAPIPLLKQSRTIVTSDIPSASGVTRETIYTFTSTRETASDDEFSLSAFGLPEPPGYGKPRHKNAWLWFTVIAATCGATTWYFIRLRRRATTP